MSNLCSRKKCTGLGMKSCSACMNVSYCSVDCQRASWREHKIIRGKKLLSEIGFVYFLDIEKHKASRLDLADREGRTISYLEKTLLFAESQFRDQVPGECYRQFRNGVTFKKDWALLTESYILQNTVATFEIALGYATETLAQLEMRRSNDNYRVMLFAFIFRVNTLLGHICSGMMRHEQSPYHWQEALAAARLCDYENKSEKQPKILIQALLNFAKAYSGGGGAKYAEEAYGIVSALNGPEHPEVQRAATTLIDCYGLMGNLVDAGRFARINYECLSDPNSNTDRKGEVFALAKKQLAVIWFLTPADQRDQGPEAAEEAETLMREACDIFDNIERGKGADDTDSSFLSITYSKLASVMIARGTKGSEVEKTILRALSFTKECNDESVSSAPLPLSIFSNMSHASLISVSASSAAHVLGHAGQQELKTILLPSAFSQGRIPRL